MHISLLELKSVYDKKKLKNVYDMSRDFLSINLAPLIMLGYVKVWDS